MLGMHLRQPGSTSSASVAFSKNKERIQRFKEIEDSKHIFQNVLDKSCLPCDMADGDFKNLPRRTIADKLLHDKIFNVIKNPK